eukprot:1768343-Heterocapsa_arctica.AAC.1
MIATRGDVYAQARDMNIEALFSGEIAGSEPTIQSSFMVSPEPPWDTGHTLRKPKSGFTRLPFLIHFPGHG